MCGISGLLDQSQSFDSWVPALSRMSEALTHRGPDASGVWHDVEAGIGLAHRRLSILDLSPEGAQPMHSPSGRFIITFNGEIYNFPVLRAELESQGVRFRGHSDTEVLIAAIEAQGLEAVLPKLVGMFSFAVWDRRDRILYLARDRMGEKPLYYGWLGERLLFGSELGALTAFPGWSGTINRDALAQLTTRGFISAPATIYCGVFKLPPGTWMKVVPGARHAEPQSYWSVADAIARGARSPFDGTPDEAVEQLDRLLRQAIGQQIVADVPLGAFLSGGVDSSAIVALMQAQSARPIKTFTIGFEHASHDEAPYAAAVARHLNTEHTEMIVTEQEALAWVPRLSRMYSEPFADSSQLPTYLVAAIARRDVTVSLSGDGGDELFSGYNRYTWGGGLWEKSGRVPSVLRKGAALALGAATPGQWDRAFERIGPLLPSSWRHRLPGDKLSKLSTALGARDEQDFYRRLVSRWQDSPDLILGEGAPSPSGLPSSPEGLSFTERMMMWDTLDYLPDDILVKVDRAGMAVSLETRMPYLDHRVVEFAWQLPMNLKLRGNEGKWLLRQVLDRYVPQTLIDRPKMGFAIPLDRWLRGPLKEWASELLNERRLRDEAYFQVKPIQVKWKEHLSGERNWEHDLWNVLMFEAWLQDHKATLT